VAQTPEVFSYDADGNLTNDGRWSYVWDAENRLIQMTVNTNVGTQYQLKCAYDSQGRRIQKIVATNGVSVYTNNFLYDGWNLIAVLTSGSALHNSFMWGNDLSGSIKGAGGVGGLLEASYYGSSATNCFPAFDGSANVAALVDAGNGDVVANYEYGSFGEIIRITGSMAMNNPFRFSNKCQDDESALLYYGYRYYNSSTGIWLDRDPIEETGGNNLYGFVGNSPINRIDRMGMIDLWDDLLDCALSIAKDWVEEYSVEADGANALYNRVSGNDDANVLKGELHSYDIGSAHFCKGFSFDPGFESNYEPSSMLGKISDCFLSKIKGIGIENALKDVPDPAKKKILEQILDQAADHKPEVTFKVKETAKCLHNKATITLNFFTAIVVDGATVQNLPGPSVGPFNAPGLYDYDDKYCSCCSCGN
jgi:RHS repeat-associated protein